MVVGSQNNMERFQNDDASVNTQSQVWCYTTLWWKYIMTHFKLVAIMLVFTITSLTIIVVTCIVLTSNISPGPSFVPGVPGTENPNERIRIYTREEWSALPASPDITNPNLKLPIDLVIIAHTADGVNCTTKEKCLLYVQNLQKYVMVNASEPISDIPYNFLVGPDGNAYEGRGWFKKGAHSGPLYNNRSIGIAFIGTFAVLEPVQQQIRIAQLLIEEGVYLRHITPNYKLYGACQLIDSQSPGEALYKIISNWPHWTDPINVS